MPADQKRPRLYADEFTLAAAKMLVPAVMVARASDEAPAQTASNGVGPALHAAPRIALGALRRAELPSDGECLAAQARQAARCIHVAHVRTHKFKNRHLSLLLA